MTLRLVPLDHLLRLFVKVVATSYNARTISALSASSKDERPFVPLVSFMLTSSDAERQMFLVSLGVFATSDERNFVFLLLGVVVLLIHARFFVNSQAVGLMPPAPFY